GTYGTKMSQLEIVQAIETLVSGQVFEIRAPRPYGKAFTAVYGPDEVQSAAEWADGLSGKVQGVYVTLNPINPHLLNRCRSAKAADVLKRRWLPIDLDPVRPTNTSATDAEKAAALDRAIAICAYLTNQEWPEPVVMDSGNGYWLLYAVDLPTEDGGL